MLLVILAISNALLGALILTWALVNTRNMRKGDFHKNYPAYKRIDMDNWSYILLYFGAMTILVPRILIVNIVFILHVIIIRYIFY